ncbi:MAG: putative transporter [Candidatus Cryptobacteroides sp.]|uniref:putative transporter n=1 Tax=Candidatus Cryptobacteroides sp. TaxID=2952915 RepID=UPI002A918A8F|nr:putative transporter [Candidatus Cryptobacteroides sp.]MDY5566659.1 putative transporter [Candidatus Cryptobacteroides sp.]
MEWLHELIFQPSYLQTVLLIAVISAIGLALGQIKVKTVSLGVAFFFFIGIIIGEICDRLDIRTQIQMVQFAQNFGLILFVYSLGVQVGPGFFTSLRQGGLKLNLFGFSAIVLTTLTAIIAFLVTGLPFPDIMGLLCGAATNTPMLGAAQQSFLEVHPDQIRAANNMASACAVGYPFGVLGVLVCMIVLRFALRGREGEKKSHNETYVAEFHVSNPALFGRMIGDVNQLTDKHLIISRLWRDGKIVIPSAKTVLRKDDHLLAVLHPGDVEQFKVIFGEQDDKDWNRPDIDWNHIDGSNLVSRHVLVTKRHLNGVKIGSLHLRNSFDINITRVGRAGIELVASPGLRLQLGDRLTVVGTETAIAKVSEILGNEEKELRNPNLVAVFIGIFLGVVLGAIPIAVPGISVPVKLGIAGGPIIVGILMGAFGPRIHLSTYTTRSANLMVRQIGIVMYLACLGYGAGHGFIDTVFCLNGLVWILVSLFIATVPVLVCGFIQSRLGKNDYAQTAGTLCAAMANPMALSYVNSNSDEEEASEAYATVYPLAMFIRVISAQLIMLLFA